MAATGVFDERRRDDGVVGLTALLSSSLGMSPIVLRWLVVKDEGDENCGMRGIQGLCTIVYYVE